MNENKKDNAKPVEKQEEEQTRQKDTGKSGDKKESISEAPEQSTQYFQDPQSGEWKIHNPAGSYGYNYLYRDY